MYPSQHVPQACIPDYVKYRARHPTPPLIFFVAGQQPCCGCLLSALPDVLHCAGLGAATGAKQVSGGMHSSCCSTLLWNVCLSCTSSANCLLGRGGTKCWEWLAWHVLPLQLLDAVIFSTDSAAVVVKQSECHQ